MHVHVVYNLNLIIYDDKYMLILHSDVCEYMRYEEIKEDFNLIYFFIV